MTLKDFRETLSIGTLPLGLSDELKAMWYDGLGDWDQAHDIAQEIHNPNGAWIHAYLHRKEGDEANAGYWYAKAGKKPDFNLPLNEEWEKLVKCFLKG